MKNNIIKILFTFGLILVLIGCNDSANEDDDFPSEDITVIVPNDAGGGTDITARGLVEQTKDDLDTDIIVENKPEGSGVAGLTEGAETDPDGYTLTMATVELGIYPNLNRMPIDYQDFSPIVTAIADPASLIVPADAPYDTLEEFIDSAKEHPNLKVGNFALGSIWHLAAAAIEDEFDLSFNHIPYDEGSAPAVSSLACGDVDVITVATGNAKSQIDDGEFKVLGIMSDERLDSFEDVPTFEEEVGMDFTVQAWATLVAPKDTPDEIIDKLSDAFTDTVQSSEFKEYMANQGIDSVEYGPEESKEMMEEDHELFKDLVKKL